MPTAAKAAGGTIRVAVAGGPLQSLSGPPIGFELCGETQASCRFASARLDGSSILIASDGRPASRVRYGWADFPVLNVYDQALLPLPPFELRVE